MNNQDFSENGPATALTTEHATSTTTYARSVKRLFDLTLASFLLPILIPTIAILWAIVRRDGGTGFFGHHRIGQNGQAFRCWKIRSMVLGAEEKLHAHLESCSLSRKEWDEEQKLTNDPRVTKFGAFIRKTSQDELPQIWNVLRGEMSFVGPRPITRDELVRYGVNATHYLASKPGINSPDGRVSFAFTGSCNKDGIL